MMIGMTCIYNFDCIFLSFGRTDEMAADKSQLYCMQDKRLRFIYYTNIKIDHRSYASAGAQSTQRPLAFPLTARSTMFGWEHVTACTAEIL
jgi:hypothetical protein